MHIHLPKHLPIYQKYTVPKNSTSQDRVCEAFAGAASLLPRKFDALKTLYRRLYGQISFQPYFTSLKLEAILGLASGFLYPCNHA